MSAHGLDIAIVGMAGRFPGARSVDELWRNLCEGRESIERLSEPQLVAAGVDPATYRRSDYVAAQGTLADIDQFDAEFFGFTPQEAAALDPQHRVFLECAWQAFESAGLDPQTLSERVGVYAGSSLNGYLAHVLPQGGRVETAEDLAALLAIDKDFLATRVSYKLDLRGPSVAVQTACSTSLVAVHLACQALLLGECELALAGGVSINVPQQVGYLYREGGIASPDGHCRPFDAQARGTVAGSGAGVVLLRRLDDALAAGDPIVAVIKGSAINNDGRDKLGFTAPSLAGQARVIREAQLAAGVDADSIGYVETHGTGTPLGDPIEIAALTQAFRQSSERTQFCAIGSIKSNLGHLDAAAGVTGLIKAALVLRHGLIPKSLHFESPNPQLQLDRSPFFVAAESRTFARADGPRRAGVSSFGIGGTNAHVILEEAPPRAQVTQAAGVPCVLQLTARSPEALVAARHALADALEREPDLALTDVAFTLAHGRRKFQHAWLATVHTRSEAIHALRAASTETSGALSAGLSVGGRRVALPGTPFEHARYWLDAPKMMLRPPAPAADRAQLCEAVWLRAGALRSSSDAAHASLSDETALERLLILTDDDALASAFAQLAPNSVRVRSAERFARQGEASFGVPLSDPEAYRALFAALGGGRWCAVHAWALRPAELERFDEAQAFGLESFLYLARAGAQTGSLARLIAVTTGTCEVTGHELLEPVHATLLGAVRSARSELTSTLVRLIDLEQRPSPHGDYAQLAARVLAEARLPAERDAVVAHRGRYRWRMELNVQSSAAAQPLPQGRVVLITGGLGGLGLALARALHEQARSRLVLLSRSPADDAQARALAQLKAAGAELLIVQADVTCSRSLAAALAQAQARYGAIHAIIHAAGSTHGGTLDLLDHERVSGDLAAKVRGALQLDALVSSSQLDFVAYCSSLSALSGGFGQSAYAAANAFLDAYAAERARKGARVLSIALDRVRGVGMAARSAEQLERLGLAQLGHEGVPVDQAVAAFMSALAVAGPSYLAISGKPIVGLPEDELALALAARSQARAARPAAGGVGDSLAEVQAAMTGIWARAFGVAEIDPGADFYKLGGESLLALEIMDEVRATFAVDLPVARFFDEPTAAALARAVHAARCEAAPAANEPELVALPRQPRKRGSAGGEP